MSDRIADLAWWRELATYQLEACAVRLLESIGELPTATRQAVFSFIPGEDELQQSWRKSMTQRHKPLAGVPCLLKDLFDVAGLPTHAGSAFLSEVRPTPDHNSMLHDVFLSAGAVFTGKTHMNEFAYGLDGTNAHFGDCPHPRFPELISGGSSSGSAFAVGRGIVPVAAGSDTAGSIRVPAAYCGVYGYRLQPDIWSQSGVFPLASSFDTAGWFTASAADMAEMVRRFLDPESAVQRPRGMYFDTFPVGYDEQLQRKYHEFARLMGMEMKAPHASTLRDHLAGSAECYSILSSIEAWDTHRSWLDSHKARYSDVVWNRIDRGRRWPSGQVEDAARRRELVADAMTGLFVDFDYVAFPAVPTCAPARAQLNDSHRQDVLTLTAPASLACLPALSVPVHLEDGRSGGIQFIFRQARSPFLPPLLAHLAELNQSKNVTFSS